MLVLGDKPFSFCLIARDTGKRARYWRVAAYYRRDALQEAAYAGP